MTEVIWRAERVPPAFGYAWRPALAGSPESVHALEGVTGYIFLHRDEGMLQRLTELVAASLASENDERLSCSVDEGVVVHTRGHRVLVATAFDWCTEDQHLYAELSAAHFLAFLAFVKETMELPQSVENKDLPEFAMSSSSVQVDDVQSF